MSTGPMGTPQRIAALALTLVLIFCSWGGSLAGEKPAGPTEAQRKAALKAVKAEKKVRDAMWAEHDMLWAAMEDNGRNRDGYAEYLCQVLREHGIKGAFVVIKDFHKMQKDEWVNLGQCQCPKD